MVSFGWPNCLLMVMCCLKELDRPFVVVLLVRSLNSFIGIMGNRVFGCYFPVVVVLLLL